MRALARFALRQARSRPLASFAAAVLLGLIARQKLALPLPACAAGFGLSLCLAILLRKRRRALAAFMLLAGLLMGMTRMGAAVNAGEPLETQYSVPMTGRVVSEPYKNPDTGRLIFKFRLDSAGGEPSSLRLRLYLRGDEDALESIAYGQMLSLAGHIWATDPVTNPYEFDFGAYLNRQGLRGYATAKIEDVEIMGSSRDARSVLIDARRAISRRIDALFPDNAGLMRALVLGDRSLLSEELRDSLNRTGTAHLISISGLHVTVLAALLSLLLRRFASKKIADLLAVALLIPYGALIGFGAPFTRALVMFAILSFAPVAGLPSDAVTRLCVALLAWLMINPLSVGDAGFSLSFAASAGIILLMPPISEAIGLEALRSRRPSASRVRRFSHTIAVYFPALLCASLAAQLATLPLVIQFFGVQSVVSLPFNLICVPLCMLGYMTGLLALLLSLLSMPAAALLARIPDGLFSLLTAVTQYSARLPAASVRIGRYPMLLSLLHWGVILAASRLSRIRLRWRKFAPLALLAVAGLASLLTFARAWGFSVVFLDAGQADCAIVRTRGHTYMIDAGDTYTPAADYLNATCLHLDGIFLSHPHQDHAGGLEDVLASFKPDAIYVPEGWFDVEEVSPAITEGMEKAQRMGVEIRELAAGDALTLSGTATLQVYGPDPENPPRDVNDMSLLALVSCDDGRVLFTGDLSQRGEPETIPEADVLKVAHHGSDKASSERFLEACAPDIAVVSVGENNYGHPSRETLDRLEGIGAEVYQTRSLGAITLSYRSGEWCADTYLEDAHEVE